MRNLSFRKVPSKKPVIEYLSKLLGQHLNHGRRVVWLAPGGSAMEIAVAASKQLPKQGLERLVVTLTDERYGPPSHQDSNWQQLLLKGFVFDDSVALPVLKGADLKQTVNDFQLSLEKNLATSDYAIGLFGVGADGHIAGIKPRSPALDTPKLVVGYKWNDFTRITITPEAMKQIDEAVVYMDGEEKRPVIEQLAHKELSLEKQPAQIIKNIKKATVYNDYLSL